MIHNRKGKNVTLSFKESSCIMDQYGLEKAECFLRMKIILYQCLYQLYNYNNDSQFKYQDYLKLNGILNCTKVSVVSLVYTPLECLIHINIFHKGLQSDTGLPVCKTQVPLDILGAPWVSKTELIFEFPNKHFSSGISVCINLDQLGYPVVINTPKPQQLKTAKVYFQLMLYEDSLQSLLPVINIFIPGSRLFQLFNAM